MPHKIWHASNINSTEWFIAGLANPKITLNPAIIPNPGTAEFLNLPETIKNILRLDKPDLIVTLNVNGRDTPVVSIEVTTTTPQSQHAKQRMPRLVAAAEADIPSLYIIPNKKLSGGSMYSLGADLYHGVNRIRQINEVPVFIYHYPDVNGRLDHDSRFPNQPNLQTPSIQGAFKTINKIIDYRMAGKNNKALAKDSWIKSQLSIHDGIAKTATVVVGNYDTLVEIKTADLTSFLAKNTAMRPSKIKQTLAKSPERIRNRDKTIIFRPGGRLLDHANDPYSGMLVFFDYVFCRTGRSVEDRNKNLIYMPINKDICNITDEFAPAGYHRFWKDGCPFSAARIPGPAEQFEISHHLQYGCVFSKTKPLRILGYFSDLIVFQDSVLVF